MMISSETAVPPIVSPDEWLAERKVLLAHEKELTKQRDALNAERRRLPMVKIDKEYVFDGAAGKQTLHDLFGDARQLIVYHFMFDPEWETGCPGCTGFVDDLGNLPVVFEKRSVRFVLVSRAPLSKLEAYKKEKGWDIPWYSSFATDFNYDYHVTLDEKIAPVENNFRNHEELVAIGQSDLSGETPGISVFLRSDDAVFHTYSAYNRGVEGLTDAFYLLDITPYGRQEDFEDSPSGWPQKPTYG